ncbi:MAG: methylated-DNA--[protein]-cysteine S-methyltransferase [Solirubrobacterales bacterium]|nr:methylated-DNA--[protein]-cysteine S-methyltransferase [Solirubrobacterales bacterium]
MTARPTELEQRLADTAQAPSDDRFARLRDRLVQRAAQEGLLDVAFAPVSSPLGELIVAATPAGVVRLAYDDETRDEVLANLAARISPRVLETPSRLDAVRRELEEYFVGTRTAFELPLDLQLSAGFRRAVLDATAQIPYGHTGTYRSVATAAGSPRAFRAAGTALATNPIPIIVPCHRVLRSGGGIGPYRGGSERKQMLLDLEAEHQPRP